MSINLNKIYTGVGDQGMTFLADGTKISKAALRIECYGTSDELNAIFGKIRTLCELSPNPEIKFYTTLLEELQNALFDLGSILAVSDSTPMSDDRINTQSIKNLEQSIDDLNESLPALKSFTIPGGSLLNCEAHLARTVCRRLERLMIRLKESESVPSSALIYINRLSDFLFVFSRRVIQQENLPEYLWQRPLQKK